MWLVIIPAVLVFLVIIAGFILSFRFTRRYHLVEIRNPQEYGLSYEDISFKSSDGITLRGWWIPAPASDRVIIQMHGHSGSMDYDLNYAAELHKAGFNVLMFDFRAHGRSDGNICTVGSLEWRDALGAIDFVYGRGYTRIGLLGFSMGGIVSILTAPRNPLVRAVIDDGGPALLTVALAQWGVERGFPLWFSTSLAYLVLGIASLRIGANLFNNQPLHHVGRIAPRPILFIHGDQDQYLPRTEFDALVEAAGNPKEVWRIPDAGHVTAVKQYPQEYYHRITSFFNQHL